MLRRGLIRGLGRAASSLVSGGEVSHRWVRLADVGCLRLEGEEVKDFLQGLLTADVSGLGGGGQQAQFALVLNPSGRIVHDCLVYALDEGGNDVLVQTERERVPELKRLLNRYRLRRPFRIHDCRETLDNFAVYPHVEAHTNPASLVALARERGPLLASFNYGDLTVAWASDPRSAFLGLRFVDTEGEDPALDLVETHREGSLADYRRSRYAFGVGEGPTELLPGKSLPLEVNADYLQGVSFHKGCYVGQELTARTHHSGVVRKRLLPLKAPRPLPAGTKLSSESGEAAGEVRVTEEGGWGLALIRLETGSPSSPTSLRILRAATESGEVEVEVWLPPWWPLQGLPGQVQGFRTQQSS